MASPELKHQPFKEVNSTPDYQALEKRILVFWKEKKIFEKTLDKKKGNFVFFEGPPTANGQPALHHVLARAFKDIFPRFKTMKGYHVTRKGGWDTHGLPVEISVEKKMGFLGRTHDRSREELENFNKLCRESVFTNIQDWNYFTERLGYWVDLDNAYITYKNDYIESVWNLLKRLWDKGLIQRDYKVVPLSPRISTTLSASEVADGYRDVDDPSVYVRYHLKDPPENLKDRVRGNVGLMVWTTTPWTLPSNVAVAVHPELDYVLVETNLGPTLIAEAAIERLKALHDEELSILARFKGNELEGWRYEAPFPQVFSELDIETTEHGVHYIVLADYVSAEDGTGLVHQAPVYGGEDLNVARRYGLPLIFGTDDHGIMQVTGEKGKFFKEADKGLTKDLKNRGLLYWNGTFRHSYPFHDRTGDPILYFAKPSWYIKTQNQRQELVEANEKINWVPNHIKQGRFGNWLANNVDWAISRERYWGTPLPFWQAEDGETLVVGSIKELENLTGRDLSTLDLHRPYIDDIVIEKDDKVFRRVPEVLDVWFDSGAMPYAQWHLVDGQNEENFEQHFPADFISEAIDQTRGWFYSLHAISVLLYGQPAYKNVICLGHLVDEQGRKMSKSVGNVIEPIAIFDKFGADSLRWYMYTTSEPGDTKRFSERIVAEAQRAFVNPLWNVYSFFVLYANLDLPNLFGPDLNNSPLLSTRPEIDRWLISRLEETKKIVNESLEKYDARAAGKALEKLVDELSNWYVRRNRRRFWKSQLVGEIGESDKLAAYATLYEALLTIIGLAAPFTPFISEAIYQNLVIRPTKNMADRNVIPSIHLTDYPEFDQSRFDEKLVREMEAVQAVVELGRAARGQSEIKTRQPLPEVFIRAKDEFSNQAIARLQDQIADELNVKKVTLLEAGTNLVNYTLKPNLPLLGRKGFGQHIPALKKLLTEADTAKIAESVRKNQAIQLGEFTLSAEDILVEASSLPGYAALEDSGFLVAFDTTLTPELVREGLARDLVRLIQQARKDAGLEVSDQIRLHLDLKGEQFAAAKEFENYIRNETLTAWLEYGAPIGTEFAMPFEGGGSFGFSRMK